MDPKTRASFKLAAALWMKEAVAEIDRWPEHQAALAACIEAGRDIRIVWHTNSDISVELTNEDGTVSEIFRDQPVPDDGFAEPDTSRKQ